MSRKKGKEKEIKPEVEPEEFDLKEQEEKDFVKFDEEYEKEIAKKMEEAMREMKVREVRPEMKEVKEYKKIWERMKQDPEINFIIGSEHSYGKAQLIILYQILEELRVRKVK